jgi:glutamine amidotransferase
MYGRSMAPDVLIVDYGVGNIFSVRRAFEACGVRATLSGDPREILDAKRLLLPGVGAFGPAMTELHARGLVEVVREFAKGGRPLLGICLGMQLLFDASDEAPGQAGLGLIPGRVRVIPNVKNGRGWRKTPHIGWSALWKKPERADWRGTVLERTREGSAVYFVHSYTAWPEQESVRVADCDYEGTRISAVVQLRNMHGCQFHPERSGRVGLGIIDQFARTGG